VRRSASGDDNILARLERDARRGRLGKQGWKHARLAWCLLASVAVIGLVGTLASLTRENLSVNKPPVLIEAKSTPPEISAPSAAALVKGGFAPLPAPEMKLAAAVVDLPPEPVKPPPMVMLKPAPEPIVKAALPAPAPAPAPKPAVKRVPAKAVAKAPPPVKTAAVKPTPVRPVVAAAPVPRPKKSAAATAAAAEPAVVDSDVALLSAIIMHASRHSAERAQQEAARCGASKKCPPQPDPMSPLKATD
jgi:outer membrane biosynthesis protein TonB